MNLTEEIEKVEGLRVDCCWCGEFIPEAAPYILPIGFNKEVDALSVGNNPYPINISFSEKEATNEPEVVWAIVTSKESEAKRNGVDLLFLTCSKQCTENVQQILSG